MRRKLRPRRSPTRRARTWPRSKAAAAPARSACRSSYTAAAASRCSASPTRWPMKNLMVDAKGGAGPSPIGDLLGPSRWIDVRGTAEEKWSPEEGWEVLNLLRPFAALHPVAAPPDLYIITPFVTVAARLRRLIEDSGVLRWTAEPRRWIHERIGTV